MKIKGNFHVVDSNQGDGVNFVTFSDNESGGLVKMMLPQNISAPVGKDIIFDAEVKAFPGKSGQMLKVVRPLGKEDN